MPITFKTRKGKTVVMQDHIWQEPIFWFNLACLVVVGVFTIIALM